MQKDKEADPTVQDQWLAIGLDCQIPPDSAHPVILHGRELALWRGQTGPAKVWEDRCPHRGMRLSFGFVREETLRCLYHGWAYGESGQCVEIPAHPGMAPPKTICANAYGAQTQHGIIWANLSEARVEALPGVPTDTDWLPIRSLYTLTSPAKVTAAIKAFDFGETAVVEAPEDNIYIVAIGDHSHLLIAIQPIGPDKTGLHIVASAGDEPAIPRRQRLAREMERLRANIETYEGRE